MKAPSIVPGPDEYGVDLESQSVQWLASEVRLARHQTATAERSAGQVALELEQARKLLEGLACIVRRLPKRPNVDKGRESETAAIEWVATASYHTSNYIPWHSNAPSWAPPKPAEEVVPQPSLRPVEVVQLPLEDVA